MIIHFFWQRIICCESSTGYHTVKAVFQVALKRKVDTVVAAAAVVGKRARLNEAALVDNRICGALFYRNVEKQLIVRFYLQHSIVAKALRESGRNVVRARQAELFVGILRSVVGFDEIGRKRLFAAVLCVSH